MDAQKFGAFIARTRKEQNMTQAALQVDPAWITDVAFTFSDSKKDEELYTDLYSFTFTWQQPGAAQAESYCYSLVLNIDLSFQIMGQGATAAESIAQAKDTWQANASLPPLSA